MNFRDATPDDSEFAFQTKKAAFRPYVEMVWGWREAEQRRLHERRFAEQQFQVVQMSGTPIGILAMVRGQDCVKVNQLFILPEHQGKGLGTACMMRIIEDAGRDGLPLRLGVLKVNGRAMSFYQRLGFRETGRNDTHVMMERPPSPAGGLGREAVSE